MPKYVKVRIAVVVNTDGDWISAGWNMASSEELMNAILNELSGDDARYFITAELEIPEEKKPIEVEASKIEKVSK